MSCISRPDSYTQAHTYKHTYTHAHMYTYIHECVGSNTHTTSLQMRLEGCPGETSKCSFISRSMQVHTDFTFLCFYARYYKIHNIL